MSDSPNMSRTRDALAAYDAHYAKGDFWSFADMSNDDVLVYFGELDRLAEAVGEAYGLDTADRNNLDTCRQCVRPGPFVRRIVEEWEKSLDIQDS